MIQILSATRSLALRARGFIFISSAEGFTARRVKIFTVAFFEQTQRGMSFGQTQPAAISTKVFFTILSSRE